MVKGILSGLHGCCHWAICSNGNLFPIIHQCLVCTMSLPTHNAINALAGKVLDQHFFLQGWRLNTMPLPDSLYLFKFSSISVSRNSLFRFRWYMEEDCFKWAAFEAGYVKLASRYSCMALALWMVSVLLRTTWLIFFLYVSELHLALLFHERFQSNLYCFLPIHFFKKSFLSPVGPLAELDQSLKIFFLIFLGKSIFGDFALYVQPGFFVAF